MIQFLKNGGSISNILPVLHEAKKTAGVIQKHYFKLDIHVARKIFQAGVGSHADVGSRLDGLISHLAVFTDVTVFDIRPMPLSLDINIKFQQLDFMNACYNVPKVSSLSSLHAIEHFGLGRYGDPIDVDGHIKGFRNLLNLLNPGGVLYIAFPIATESKVCFNAHRIFAPIDILSWDDPSNFKIIQFDYLDDNDILHENVDVFDRIENLKYGCGIYTIKKL